MAAFDLPKIRVFLCKTNAFTEFPYRSDITCEDVCILCCKSLNILPTARLLFGLRVQNTDKWIIQCCTPEPDLIYEFRMRFKVPDLDYLYKIDPNAYEFLYTQMRHDVVNERISEIQYPLKKDNVVGLGVIAMYIDFLENKGSAENIESNFKQYLPNKIVQTHKKFVKAIVRQKFQEFIKKQREITYVKSTYMHTVADLSPNYLMETYNANVEHLPDEEIQNMDLPVYVQLDAFDSDGPAIKVSLKYKIDWLLVTRLENVYALYREGNEIVRVDISGSPRGYCLKFALPHEVKSFMSYVSGYFRLMTKWMFDPCVQFVTPSLQELRILRCHGPVGGDYSYWKIRDNFSKNREKNGTSAGAYIIRQCDKEYDTYYIDIIIKGTHIETSKITRNRDKWLLHVMGEDVLYFDKLTDLASAIQTDSDTKVRIPPSEYEKPPMLLICLPKNRLSEKTVIKLSDAELQSKCAQLIDPRKQLRWYHNSARDCDYNRMTSWIADWIQPSGIKDVVVTLKVLKHKQDFPALMELADTWSRIYSPEFLKIYGMTLSTPYTLVTENSEYGPLNKFLYSLQSKVPLECLLDVAHGLVRGIAYLQEQQIYHGLIRCSSMMVTKYDPRNCLLVAKISDPGLPRTYNSEDLAWIPINLHQNLCMEKFDFFTELWAFATTMWEIFARGKDIRNLKSKDLAANYRQDGAILPKPEECPYEIFEAMMDGWSDEKEKDKRFNQMALLGMINSTKQQLSHAYSRLTQIDETLVSDENSSTASGISTDTKETSWNSNSCNDVRSNIKSNNSISLNGNGGLGSMPFNYFNETPSVHVFEHGKVIRDKPIGSGHYGQVFRGEIHYNDENSLPLPVAIKILKPIPFIQDYNDFKREIDIMKKLKHPNIVKIIMSINDDPLSIIMEYVECGSFDIYLSSQPNLTNEKLLIYALDIAKGMEYLGFQNVIHRDLAARNILVDRERVKISDFGLAQQANNDGYYLSQCRRELPIKWYAPESLRNNKFSFYSDVWSYGVTLFEMFSRGQQPNLDGVELHERNKEEFINKLEIGKRLHRPERCPQIVYDKLMMPCWHANPKMRPSFTEIISFIHSIENEYGERI